MEKKNNHQSNEIKKVEVEKAQQHYTKSFTYIHFMFECRKNTKNFEQNEEEKKKNHKSPIGNENKITNVKLNEKKSEKSNEELKRRKVRDEKKIPNYSSHRQHSFGTFLTFGKSFLCCTHTSRIYTGTGYQTAKKYIIIQSEICH